MAAAANPEDVIEYAPMEPEAVLRCHRRRVSEFSQFSELDRFELPEVSRLLEQDEGSEGGHALPSTPQDESYDPLEDELVDQVINREESTGDLDFSQMAHNAIEHAEELVHKAEEFAHKVWAAGTRLVSFHALPPWAQDNDYIHKSHRAPMPSFYACFRSIFYIHTETVNIWTHLLGCIGFVIIATYFLTRPSIEIDYQEKVVFSCFFAGAIVCMGASFIFHTVGCHSKRVLRLFSKFDYCGISLLIVGSFIPWLYYGFYCSFVPKVIYLTCVICLGSACMVVSLVDKFGEPEYRSLRAGLFLGFGLSGVVPAVHYLYSEGWFNSVPLTAVGWLALMGALYVAGALLYAFRVPERWFPGKCDIYFQSHQIFHVLVVAGAMVHYHGVSEMAMHRLTNGECSSEQHLVL
ncbi:adiponectin receptor protein-like [Pollicipes pollicipes]|uniref:adiponectin receptor protein-like n=1 Tax=Pollicipes pollicipes TaxID=41117 RepID=UPI0018858170|nr:adiponectin receptor protein-like isoform X1 [Pollicipes pollicipes]XP_037086467.1 adiponectin receptor protein-like [Pollicipes pollicipes]XP_037086468.1 adiponectin receptor protein-like [Pollicipes pollicipes]